MTLSNSGFEPRARWRNFQITRSIAKTQLQLSLDWRASESTSSKSVQQKRPSSGYGTVKVRASPWLPAASIDGPERPRRCDRRSRSATPRRAGGTCPRMSPWSARSPAQRRARPRAWRTALRSVSMVSPQVRQPD